MHDNNDAILLELGGRTYELKCTHSVLKNFSRRTGLSMVEMTNQIMRYDVASVMMWCLMQRCDSTLTEAQADGLLDALPPQKIITLVSEAITAAFPPVAEDEQDQETPPTAAGTGTRA